MIAGAGVLLGAALLAAATVPEAPAGSVERPRVQSTLDDVLKAPEYRRLRRSTPAPPTPEPKTATTQGGRRPAPSRPSEGAPAPGSGAGAGAGLSLAPLAAILQVFVYALLGIALVVLVALIVRHVRRGSTPDAAVAVGVPIGAEAAVEPGDQSADECLRQALAHARAGRHREAIRFLLMGAMSAIERAGLIRARKGLTNGDYLRAVSRDPRLRAALEPIVFAFDEVHFGRRSATGDRFEECLRHYRAAFQVR